MEIIDRRKFLKIIGGTAFGVLSLQLLTGCDLSLEGLQAWYQDYLANKKESEDEDEGLTDPVVLKLTFPAGRSPNVFTSGWVFGARCTAGGTDLSDSVQWSGSGTFVPATGKQSRPSFNSEGANTITLSVKVGDKDYTKTFNVNAVSPGGYAAVGTLSQVPADAHGCPACPHPAIGPITTGSPNVLVNGRPAARVGDVGIHAACCGPNTFEIISGDSSVLINGRAAASFRMSQVKHCGGMGRIVEQ